MGFKNVTATNGQLLGTVIVTTTELQVAVVTLPTLPFDFAQVLLFASITITSGTGTTAFQARIRQGNGITGLPIYNSGNLSITAGNTGAAPLVGFDTPGSVAGQQYSLTVQQVAATGNGTVISASLVAMAL